jgi:hypothetical protein
MTAKRPAGSPETGWRLLCLAAHHGPARPCCRCQTSELQRQRQLHPHMTQQLLWEEYREIARLRFVVDKIPQHEPDRVRRNLLDYCHRDALAMVRLVETLGRPGPSCSMVRLTRANKPNGYLLGS